MSHDDGCRLANGWLLLLVVSMETLKGQEQDYEVEVNKYLEDSEDAEEHKHHVTKSNKKQIKFIHSPKPQTLFASKGFTVCTVVTPLTFNSQPGSAKVKKTLLGTTKSLMESHS